MTTPVNFSSELLAYPLIRVRYSSGGAGVVFATIRDLDESLVVLTVPSRAHVGRSLTALVAILIPPLWAKNAGGMVWGHCTVALGEEWDRSGVMILRPDGEVIEGLFFGLRVAGDLP